MKAWTDYPIVGLGDKPNDPSRLAPIREIEIIGWDGDKYAKVLVAGVITYIKHGYLYTEPKRLDDNPKTVSIEDLNRLMA